MASGSNGLTWFGNLCYQFNGLETDDMLIEEPMKYLSEKLMVAGDSFLQFCSDISDVLPTSIFSYAEQTLSEEEETTVLPAHETSSNDVNINHDSSTDEFVAKETLQSCVAQSVGNSERTVNEDDHADLSVSEHSSEGAEKFTVMTWPEFISKYTSPVDRTAHYPVFKVMESNDLHEDKLVDSSSEKFLAKETQYYCVAQAVKNSELTVNEDELDDDHAGFSVSEHSSERSERDNAIITLEKLLNKLYYTLPWDEAILSSSARSTDAFCSSDSSSVNHELEPPNAVEPDQFLSDSDSDSDYELEPLKKLMPDQLMELSDVLDIYASPDEVSDCDVKEEDNEVTEPSYIQKLDESLIVVEEETFQPKNKKPFKKRSLKRTDAEPEEDESETERYDEDFCDSDSDWEFV